MGQAIGQILPLAVGVAISPVPIIGVVLMLATPQARAERAGVPRRLDRRAGDRGRTVVLLLSSGAGASSGGEPATWVGVS